MKLRDAFDNDPHWHPGKSSESAQKPGPKPKFTERMKIAISSAAMSLKRAGVEPTASAVIARCPVASTNPDTGNAFGNKLILSVFREKCYDLDPAMPWERLQPLSKTALPDWLEKLRAVWGKHIEEEERAATWYANHCIWMDPCSTIIPGSLRSVFDQTQSNNGKGPRWMSKDARIYSRNLRASRFADKQCQWADKRVWWFLVFTRGKVRFPIMDDEWKQNGEGMATMVGRLPGPL